MMTPLLRFGFVLLLAAAPTWADEPNATIKTEHFDTDPN